MNTPTIDDVEMEGMRRWYISQLDDKPDPDKFAVHEALHVTNLIADLLDRELLQHPAILNDKKWFAIAFQVSALLGDLYQKIGVAHFDTK